MNKLFLLLTVAVVFTLSCKKKKYTTTAPSFTVSGSWLAGDTLSFITPDTVTDITWQFGDGTTGSGNFAKHAYASPGQYTVSMVFNDNTLYPAAVQSIAVAIGTGRLAGTYKWSVLYAIDSFGVHREWQQETTLPLANTNDSTVTLAPDNNIDGFGIPMSFVYKFQNSGIYYFFSTGTQYTNVLYYTPAKNSITIGRSVSQVQPNGTAAYIRLAQYKLK